MAKKASARKKSSKKKSSKKAPPTKHKSHTCRLCGGENHNARTCPTKEDDKPIEAATSPEDVFDLSDVSRASEMEDAPEHQDAKINPEQPVIVPGEVPRNTVVVIPQRTKKRTKAEEAFWAKTTKAMADGHLATAGDLSLDIPRISSGNFGIDVSLYGGIPQGRFVRFTGLPKSAKTGTCLNTVASYQALHCSECFGLRALCKCKSEVPDVLWIDVEHRLNQMLRWVQGHGVNLECLRVLGPPTGQDVIDLVDHVIREAPASKIGLIVIDSIAHITAQEEINKATKDGPTVGRNAMLMNSGWRKWTSALHSLGIDNPRKPTVLCINQIRHKVGVNYGSPETNPGGIGQDYASTVDLRFSAGSPNFVVWKESTKAEQEKGNMGSWVTKQKGYKSSFKPGPDQTPDFIAVNYRVTASGHCPYGRSGEFNYWLQATHGHRCGDPDNGLQLWNYCKRYDLIEQEGHTKRLFGHEATTFDALMEAFRADPTAQRKAWVKLMEKLCDDR